MAGYSVVLKRTAARELEALPLKDRRRVAARIGALAADPRSPGIEKISGQDKYRIRQGGYRVLYTIDDPELTVTVVRIGHRGDVYP